MVTLQSVHGHTGLTDTL